ncbi:MAG TPA: DUF4388 domain-containing protein [candidate division Zixibacteria bacterium]|nr:DUF4388 domain-containing protein [candidate division Zixibacteria bacterium]
MGPKTRKFRLDEILVREGIVSDDQVKEALLRQKAHGGKLGSQLLYHRYIDETGLVRALAKQLNCEGVVLSNLEIPEIVIKFIPARVAIARKIIPFDYDTESNTVKIACEDPTDTSLINELNFVARGKKVKLYVAAELALNTAIARYYLGRDTSLDKNLLLEIPETATDTGKIAVDAEVAEKSDDDTEFTHGTVLLVTDEEYSGPMLQSLLERDNFKVMTTDSADDAIEMLENRTFHTVFIKDTVSGDYIDLIDRLRKLSPRTVVRYYETSSALLLEQDSQKVEGNLLIKNLDLFTSLLSSKEKQPFNHSATVGKYVERLCRRLGLPYKDCLSIINAAYVHDLAKYYYHDDSTSDPRKTITLTIKLLQSLNYDPVVIETLRSMYLDLKGKYTKRLPIEVLGGNIVTIVDLFCDNIPPNERLSLDKFEAIQKKFRDLTGKLFMVEVVEAFIVMIKEEILNLNTSQHAGQVMILAEDPNSLYSIEFRLKSEGFRSFKANDIDSFADLYERSRPDFVILIPFTDRSDIPEFITKIAAHGVDYKATPTFLLVDSSMASSLTPVLDHGIEDIIPADGNFDLLMAKIRKLQAQLDAQNNRDNSESESGSGTKGRLSDMNLIDLLQALGPSRRTVRITVKSPSSDRGELILYLLQGQIIFASLADMVGPTAVYEAISWLDGKWTVEPINENLMPEPNNDLSNESILMEGCRLLDEKTRAGQLI